MQEFSQFTDHFDKNLDVLVVQLLQEVLDTGVEDHTADLLVLVQLDDELHVAVHLLHSAALQL